jgi:glycyl-tRNA synthetase
MHIVRLRHTTVWEASGHIANFTDPLSECRSCNKRVRVDKLAQQTTVAATASGRVIPAPRSTSLHDLGEWLTEHLIPCPHCGAVGAKGLPAPRAFNLLFTTRVGPSASGSSAEVKVGLLGEGSAAAAATVTVDAVDKVRSPTPTF